MYSGMGGGTGGGSGARSSWKPLGTGAGGISSGGYGGGKGMGMAEGGLPPGGVKGYTQTAPPASMTGGFSSIASKGVSQPGTRKRTEFIVLFFWREPTPSDKLRSMQEGTGTGAGTKGFGGFQGGMMPGFPGGTMPPNMPGPPGGGN
jgi:hypothetical protein